jgi:5'-AMP-activated protein kinase regulatory beta subunit
MGSVQARQQQIVASRGTVQTQAANPNSLAPGGPSAAERAAPSAGDVAGRDERIPVVFTWTGGGANVFLASSFNGWREQIPMVRSGGEFHVVQDLPRGIHQYKFIVDDHWRYANDQPKTQDSDGNMNNILDISNYQRWKLDEVEEHHREESFQSRSFGQNIPDPNDYTMDAPAIPQVLNKSVLCAVPVRAASTASQPLSIPTHSFCDHIYMHDKYEGGANFGLAKVSVTHRFGSRYSTAVLVTRSPFDGCGLGPGPTASCGVNLLKRAVVRSKPPAASG